MKTTNLTPNKLLQWSAIILFALSSIAAGSPQSFSADIAVTDIYPGNQPYGQFWLRITNHGPGTLHNVNVNVSCSSERTDKNNGQLSSGGNVNFSVTLNLSPGQTQAYATGLTLDTTVFDYLVGCQVFPGFDDPKPGNNSYSEALKTQGGGQFTADIALTDIYAGNKPYGQFWVRVTNHGPGTLKNVTTNVKCSAYPTRKQGFGAFINDHKSFNVSLNLAPGQTQAFPTGLSLDTNVFSYYVECVAYPGFNDPVVGNNQYGEHIQ
jgi:hypothetical protein